MTKTNISYYRNQLSFIQEDIKQIEEKVGEISCEGCFKNVFSKLQGNLQSLIRSARTLTKREFSSVEEEMKSVILKVSEIGKRFYHPERSFLDRILQFLKIEQQFNPCRMHHQGHPLALAYGSLAAFNAKREIECQQNARISPTAFELLLRP